MYVEIQRRATSAEYVQPVRFLARVSRPVTGARKVTTGQTLFREGDRANSVFEVLTGVLSLSRVMEDGRRQIIGFCYPGDFVGFPANGRHHTDCDVLDDGQLIAHRREALENGQAEPELHRRLIDAALREITGMQDHCLMLGRKSASEKTASFLSAMMDRIGIPLGNYTQVSIPMSRSDIADFLGLTTETVSRAFSQLRESGVIALEDARSMIVLQPEDLRNLAQAQ